jgi:hypothetical protein
MATELPLVYRQNPRPVGFEVVYKLADDRLTVDTGRRIDHIPLSAVEQLRLTYEPQSLGRGALRAKIRLKDGRSISFSSLSWKSMIEAKSLRAEYGIFLHALIARIAQANPNARFVAGQPLLRWIAIVVVTAALLTAVVSFAWRAAMSGTAAAALLGIGVAAVGIWQLEPMVRLNRPRRFTADDVPSALVS